jgi:HprK-related kinase A
LTLGELGRPGLERALQGPGLRLRTGPVVTCIASRVPEVAEGLALLYAEHRTGDDFADFFVRVDRPTGVRRWVRPQVQFQFDGSPPFYPLPGDQGFPILEWGLNWCLSVHCHQYLMLHAAVVERAGRALLLPAPPGSGKSTLCAGLTLRGWRLLSDELALLAPESGEITPLARPISLKNASIGVIAGFSPEALFSRAVHDTVKGTVAHLKPPPESVRRQDEVAAPRWVVLPRYVASAPARLVPLSKARAFMQLADSAFNYHLHGARGFEVLARLVERCDCFEFSYGDLDEAVKLFQDLSEAP